MAEQEAWDLLTLGFMGHLGSTGSDAWPYVVPLTYAVLDKGVYFHHTAAPGHLQANLAANPRVCFEVAQPGLVFPSGENAQCQTSLAYESVILFGRCGSVADRQEKRAFFDVYMAKYADPEWERPDVWPDLETTAVCRIDVERITGKRRPMTVAPKWQHLFEGRGR